MKNSNRIFGLANPLIWKISVARRRRINPYIAPKDGILSSENGLPRLSGILFTSSFGMYVVCSCVSLAFILLLEPEHQLKLSKFLVLLDMLFIVMNLLAFLGMLTAIHQLRSGSTLYGFIWFLVNATWWAILLYSSVDCWGAMSERILIFLPQTKGLAD